MEKTLVILKPDAVKRGIIGEIISRFEKVGLKIVGVKMLTADQTLLDKHYPKERQEWVKSLGEKTIQGYISVGEDPKKKFGHDDPALIGETVRTWLVKFMKSGPVLAIVLEGPHAVEVVRKIVGHTMPHQSLPGTIRGDYSWESSYTANSAGRPIKNLIHASGNHEEAEHEVSLWFSDSELADYQTVHQKAMEE